MWRDDFDALGPGRRARSADGAQVVVAGGPDYYPGSRTSSPAFSFHVTGLRVAGEGDLLAQLERLRQRAGRRGPVRAAEGAAAPAPAAHDRRRHRRGRQGARRRAGRPAPPRLGRAPGLGLRARAGPPRRAAHHAARCRTSPRSSEVEVDHRRARRRVAGRPVLLLRRDAVPDGRAAARARDRLGRPPHRPHADRRRRRRRAARRRRTPPRRRCRCDCRRGARGAGARRARLAAPRPARGPRRAPGCSRGSRARRPSTSAAIARALHQHLRELRASARRGARTTERARDAAPRARPARAAGGAAAGAAPPRGATALDALALALAAHDPERVVERGYALVEDGAGERRDDAPRRRARRAACACASPTPPSMPGSRRTDVTRHDAAADLRDRDRRAWRRSSAAWTPARPACARRSTSCKEGRGARRVLRRRARRGRPRPGGAAPRRARRAARGAARTRVSLWDRARRPAAARSRTTRSSALQRDVSSDFTRQSARSSACTAAARRASARTSPTTPTTTTRCRQAGPVLPLAGELDARRRSATHLGGLDLWPGRRSAPASRALPRWAYESAALDLALRQAGTPLHDGARPRAAARCASSSRCGSASRRRWRRCARGWTRYPALRFKLDPTSDWTDELVARARGDGRGRQRRPQGPLRRARSSTSRADPALYRRVRRGLPGRLDRGPARSTPETDAVLEPHRDRITWDAPIHSRRRHRGAAVPAADGQRQAVARSARCAALLAAYEHCDAHGIGMYGGGQFELGPGRGQIQYLASLFHPDGAQRRRARAATTTPTRPPGLPTSPAGAAADAIGFRWGDWIGR